MKTVILAGGLGTRISEETHLKPKPMVEIGGKPILWHILKIYSAYGINEFIICVGYKGYTIKEYFANYCLHMSNVTFDMTRNQMWVHQQQTEPWKVTLVDTGDHTATGGRLKRVKEHLNGDSFCFTYGDGVSNIDIKKEVEFHKTHGLLATVAAVQPPGRYGTLEIQNEKVSRFVEKPRGDDAWINGGFFVLKPEVLSYIEGDQSSWESHVVPQLALKGQLAVFKHPGFWQPMDTLREKMYLEELWQSGRAPWKVWEDSRPDESRI